MQLAEVIVSSHSALAHNFNQIFYNIQQTNKHTVYLTYSKLEQKQHIQIWLIEKKRWQHYTLIYASISKAFHWITEDEPESGSEFRSAHSTRGMALVSPDLDESLRLREALSTMFFTSDRNIMVWTSFTSEYSGSQCMWALATRTSCFSGLRRDFPATSKKKKDRK